MQRNIVLTGFMAAGKSLLSQKLAALCQRPVVSTDELIVERERRPIKEIFQNSGEAYFREVESCIIAELSQRQGLIIDCGGGVVIDPVNRKNLKDNGIVFYLKTSPEVILERAKDEGHRPLLNTENPFERIVDLLAKREAFYNEADHIVGTDHRDPDEICEEILAIIHKEGVRVD